MVSRIFVWIIMPGEDAAYVLTTSIVAAWHKDRWVLNRVVLQKRSAENFVIDCVDAEKHMC